MIHSDLAVIDDIANGKHDAVLDRILDTARARRKATETSRLHAMQPGDKIRIKDTRPKYLNGCTGEVVKINQTTASVKLDTPPQPKWGGTIRVPASCVAFA